MDIEGAEPGALLGASGIMARCRPIMAVCAYRSVTIAKARLGIPYSALPDLGEV